MHQSARILAHLHILPPVPPHPHHDYIVIFFSVFVRKSSDKHITVCAKRLANASVLCSLLPGLESNQDYDVQSVACYLYTTRQKINTAETAEA